MTAPAQAPASTPPAIHVSKKPERENARKALYNGYIYLFIYVGYIALDFIKLLFEWDFQLTEAGKVTFNRRAYM